MNDKLSSIRENIKNKNYRFTIHALMQCGACGGNMEKKRGELDLRINGELYIVKNVLHEECTNCGEKVVAPNTSENIFSIIQSNKFETREMKIPLVELSVA